jgi:hypothetical protein
MRLAGLVENQPASRAEIISPGRVLVQGTRERDEEVGLLMAVGGEDLARAVAGGRDGQRPE